ncbi:MAG TPA: radical SAM protein [Kiritimatiellia bacterium]|nr:radical SAM protein [Kiritimatiellia bacterium]
MIAKNNDPASIAWTLGFRQRAYALRIPISATLELTSRCNLRCRHCYLGNQTEQHKKRDLERDTESVLHSLDEWAAAGCLYLLITGGDPMMRKDFPVVYRHARELGMLVTVFCDGILVNDAIVELFRELPPRKVEISIYGGTSETYEAITRVQGSYGRAWTGIRRLLDAGIRVGLKTVLMKLNEHEMDLMEAQAAAAGVPFRYDAAIFPCLPNGSSDPLDLRVSPEAVVKRDLASPERRRQWQDRLEQTAKLPEDERLYGCSAGATSFYVDPFGNHSPCLMTTHYRYRLEEGEAFGDLWQGRMGEIRSKRKTKKTSCLSGPLRGACTHCPAFNFLETGDEETESDYIREVTRLRYRETMKFTIKQEHEA